MKCKSCNENEGVKYSKYASGNFCSRECAKSFSTKEKRKEINKKISEIQTGSGHSPLKRNCLACHSEMIVVLKDRNKKKYCNRKCQFEAMKQGIYLSKQGHQSLSDKSTERCKSLDERMRLREIGRKGGFGEKGYTISGIYYQSKLERMCFEYLETKNIIFEPHKNIPESSKISDIYIPSLDLWIELDGIDREKRKEWLGKDYNYWLEKLDLYKERLLNFKVIKTYNKFIQELNL